MKVLFVNPACADPRVTDEDALVMPMGLYYLSALLMEKGIETRLVNLAPYKDQAQAAFSQAMDQERPDIVGFSVTNPSRMNAQACAVIARKKNPGAVILFGGPAPTFLAGHLFGTCPALDVVVKGEGEESCLALVRALIKAKEENQPPKLGPIPGLVFRKRLEDPEAPARELEETGAAPVLEDLDTLPHPARYFAYAHLAMSRGCPGSCTFCGSPKFWGNRQVRFHSVDWFFTEIRMLFQKGVNHFFISDDTFTMDRERVLQLCKRIVEKKLPITWNAISRVDHVDEELFYWMRRAGCIQISFGVESGSKEIKKILGKPVANDRAVKAFDLARRFGIMPRAYFIYGAPGETEATIQESIDLMVRLRPLSAIFYLLVVFPGTHLYNRAVKQGKISDEIWETPMEDLPWFELDPELDFERVKGFGQRLRSAFAAHLTAFVSRLELREEPELAPYHADFLSRLAMTFSHGDYSNAVPNAQAIAMDLFTRALAYAPDARAYLGLAMAHGRNRKQGKADEMVRQGLAHFPGHRGLTICRGINQMNQGKFDTALATFNTMSDGPDIRQYIHICNTKLKG